MENVILGQWKTFIKVKKTSYSFTDGLHQYLKMASYIFITKNELVESLEIT